MGTLRFSVFARWRLFGFFIFFLVMPSHLRLSAFRCLGCIFVV